MDQRAKDLAERLTAFNNDMISFVEFCSDDDQKLDRTSHLELVGGEISTQQFLENFIIASGREMNS